MTDQKAQKVCFDILSQRRNKVMEKADIMFPSVSLFLNSMTDYFVVCTQKLIITINTS